MITKKKLKGAKAAFTRWQKNNIFYLDEANLPLLERVFIAGWVSKSRSVTFKRKDK